MSSADGEAANFSGQSLSEVLPCYYDNGKPPRNVFDRMITIVVGQGSAIQNFQVHRGLLCYHSGLFKRLLNGPFRGNDSHTLPAEKPATFQLFYDWLYSGEVVYDEATELLPKAIVELYFFADAHMVQQLKDRALELYFLRFLKDWEAPQDLTQIVYEKTAGNSSMRKVHVDILIETFGFENLREYIDDDPKEFFIDLLEACRDRQVSPGSCSAFVKFTQWIEEKKARFCELYHEHPALELYPTYEPESDSISEQPDQEEQSEITEVAETRECFGCGQVGHIKRDCPPRGPFANIRCWNCEQTGHKFWKCPEPRDWSKVKCMRCKEHGHTEKRCPHPEYEDEEIERDSGFGGDAEWVSSFVRGHNDGWGA